MKNFLLGIVTMLAAILACSFLYLRLGFVDVRADVPPGAWERYWMSNAVRASVRRHAPELQNPLGPTDETLITGANMYKYQCALCHGNAGSEKPPAGPPPLYPEPPHLPTAGTQYTEAQIFWIAKHGIRRTGMVASGAWNSDDQLWALAAYVKRMNSLPASVKERLSTKQEGR